MFFFRWSMLNPQLRSHLRSRIPSLSLFFIVRVEMDVIMCHFVYLLLLTFHRFHRFHRALFPNISQHFPTFRQLSSPTLQLTNQARHALRHAAFDAPHGLGVEISELRWGFKGTNPPCFNGEIHYKWSFSLAMLNYQRVNHGLADDLHIFKDIFGTMAI